ncbi:MAG TPA: hypothetical protein HPP83_01570 [Candidatus Hydrogenedentes bacterium]|nr:hypothetical protein [Candidatus Hydrogenedentota bacterium]
MTDVWRIAEYVEEHPNDHAQRWRLAKKLYMAWEYRHALEHLQILRNEWEPNVHVARYLAATFYRLGRYDESIAELERAIDTWAEDIPLREQLARVLEVADRLPDAAAAWEKILEIDPEHSLAPRAVERLRTGTAKEVEIDFGLDEDDGGTGAEAALVCAECGAQNSREFERCWQCHAMLEAGTSSPAEDEAPAPAPRPAVKPSEKAPFPAWLLGGGLSLVALVSCGIYLSLHHIAATDGGAENVSRTMTDLLARELVQTHVILGLVLLVAWPAVLWGTLAALQAAAAPRENILITGLVLAGLAYVLSWAPGLFVGLALLVPGIVSLILLIAAFRIPFSRAVAVWLAQCILIVVVAFLGLMALEGLAPIKEIGAIANYALERNRQAAPGGYVLPETSVPAEFIIEWVPTGSSWLDRCAPNVSVELGGEAAQGAPIVRFEDEQSRLLAYIGADSEARSFVQQVGVARPYKLTVSGENGAQVSVTIRGVLEPRLVE